MIAPRVSEEEGSAAPSGALEFPDGGLQSTSALRALFADLGVNAMNVPTMIASSIEAVPAGGFRCMNTTSFADMVLEHAAPSGLSTFANSVSAYPPDAVCGAPSPCNAEMSQLLTREDHNLPFPSARASDTLAHSAGQSRPPVPQELRVRSSRARQNRSAHGIIKTPAVAEDGIEDRRRRNRESSARCYYNRKQKIAACTEELETVKRRAIELYDRELELRRENAVLKNELVLRGGSIPRHMQVFKARRFGQWAVHDGCS